MQTCVRCGHVGTGDERFCSHCGHALPSSDPPRRQTVVAGGNVEQNVVYETHYHGSGPSHHEHVAEYERTFRNLIEQIRDGGRTWLTSGERQTLDEHAKQLGLEKWECAETEKAVLSRLHLMLAAPPKEFWSLATGGSVLAKGLTQPEAVQALAVYLDEEAPSRLLVWRTGDNEWLRLSHVTEIDAAVRHERIARLESMLIDWVMRGQPESTISVLQKASKHLTNREIQASRRSAEQKSGRPLTIPPAVLETAPRPHTPVAARLDGTWEAEQNPAMRLIIAPESVRLRSTYPVVREGQGLITDRVEDPDKFRLVVSISNDVFGGVRGIDGSVTASALRVELIRGTISAFARGFVTSYRRI